MASRCHASVRGRTVSHRRKPRVGGLAEVSFAGQRTEKVPAPLRDLCGASRELDVPMAGRFRDKLT